QDFDASIRTEMNIFAKLIQRREPRNMIRTLFLGRLDHERLKKSGMNPKVAEAVSAGSRGPPVQAKRGDEPRQSFSAGGLRVDQPRKPVFDGRISGKAYWFEDEPKAWGKELLRARLAEAEVTAAGWRSQLDEAERRAADYLLVTKEGFPAYLGGLFAAGLTLARWRTEVLARPLDGVRVLDLSKVLAGPLCAQYLGDLGAEIIKVEAVGQGDETRGWPPFPASGLGTVFLSANRNKRSIAIDMKSEKGRALVHEMARSADIAIESFGTGVAERLAIDSDSLRALNDRLIHCSISGFGRSGPLKHAPGYDVILQAFSGVMSMTGDENGGYIRSP